ncbi:MAG TPA: amidohydrolase family protein [Candidatus Binataceae bacterium]|nr:amidohydrolase family protein [Candidatus Binataceae bacterium]
MAAHPHVISADSHMMEPGNLWVDRLDQKFRDDAPRVIKSEGKGGFVFVAPGLPPFPVAGGFAAGRSGEELKQFLKEAGQDSGYEAARPSGWDPVERLKDQDIDGVQAEVLYTTLGMTLFGLHNEDLQRACFKVYNDWVAEFSSHDRKRLIGIGLVSLEDIGEGVKELERCAKIGLRGAMIWGAPPREKPYYISDYDPFWQAAQDLEMPLSLHVITGKKPPKSKEEREKVKSKDPSFSRGYMNLIHEVQRSLTDLLFGGVMMRFPRLKLVSAENDSGWIAHYMYRADHAFEKFGALSTTPLEMKPSEYIRRNLWATFQDDPIGPMLFRYFGEDNFMWASDFPHTDSTWPNSLKVIDQDFEGVPPEVTQKIICDNAAKLYKIDLN